MKTDRKVKIRKSKMKFPLISMWNVSTGSRLQKESPNIFPTHIEYYYKEKVSLYTPWRRIGGEEV
jgi:hypothetical protein